MLPRMSIIIFQITPGEKTMVLYYSLQNDIDNKIMSKNNNKETTNFGKRLAKIRKQRGMTQGDLGKKIGVSQRVIAYYEKETQFIPAGNLNKIAGALNVSADEILGIKSLSIEAPPNRRLAKRLRHFEKLPSQHQKAILHYIDAPLFKRKTS